ncbi:hypothetical protein G6F69_009228 [Rhizopus microsporus]|nr:hypothetical protein G6F69_009228 [Rhizopus microsporus]
MEEDHHPQLALVRYSGRIQDPIQFNTNPMDDKEIPLIHRRPTSSRQCSRFILELSEPNKIRPILDCRKINQFVQCNHFKMEGVPALRDIVEPNDFLTKIDLKDAYIVVPIHPDSRKFLSFSHKGTIYQYKSLAFGLSNH